MDKRFRVYEEITQDKVPERRCIAFYGPVIKGFCHVISANQSRPNSPVSQSIIFAEYEQDFCRPITEKRARKIHPRLFAYLDGYEGFSTVTIKHQPHEGKKRLRFEGCPVLDTSYPRIDREKRSMRATLLGTDRSIEEVKKYVQAHSDTYTLEIDILPALPEQFNDAAVWNFERELSTEDIKEYLKTGIKIN